MTTLEQSPSVSRSPDAAFQLALNGVRAGKIRNAEPLLNAVLDRQPARRAAGEAAAAAFGHDLDTIDG